MSEKKGLLVVLTKPISPEREDEFNEWYDGHLDEICRPEGVNRVSRYKLTKVQVPGQERPETEYLAIYELDDPEVTLPVMLATGHSMTDAVDHAASKIYCVEQISTYTKGQN